MRRETFLPPLRSAAKLTAGIHFRRETGSQIATNIAFEAVDRCQPVWHVFNRATAAPLALINRRLIEPSSRGGPRCSRRSPLFFELWYFGTYVRNTNFISSIGNSLGWTRVDTRGEAAIATRSIIIIPTGEGESLILSQIIAIFIPEIVRSSFEFRGNHSNTARK